MIFLALSLLCGGLALTSSVPEHFWLWVVAGVVMLLLGL